MNREAHRSAPTPLPLSLSLPSRGRRPLSWLRLVRFRRPQVTGVGSVSIRSAIEFDVAVVEVFQPGDNCEWPMRRH